MPTDPQTPDAATLSNEAIAAAICQSVGEEFRGIADAARDLAYRVGVTETEAKRSALEAGVDSIIKRSDQWQQKYADERSQAAALVTTVRGALSALRTTMTEEAVRVMLREGLATYQAKEPDPAPTGKQFVPGRTKYGDTPWGVGPRKPEPTGEDD